MEFFKPTWGKIGIIFLLSIFNYLLTVTNNPYTTVLDLFTNFPSLMVGMTLNPPEGNRPYPMLGEFIFYMGHYAVFRWLFITTFNIPLFYLLSCAIVFFAHKLKKQKKQ